MDGGNTLAGLVGFARALRHSGMPCGPRRVQAFLAATEHIGLDDRSALYWAGRVTLCADPDDLARFDAAFECWFGEGILRTGAGRSETRRPAHVAALSADGDSGEAGESELLAAAASDTEVLRRRDLSELDPAEREYLRRMLAALHLCPPSRPALRLSPSRRGTLDPRATLRDMLRMGGETVRMPRHSRSRRPRRVVLLIDISGSMSPYADALLRFAHTAMRQAPLSTEVFTLGTRMTRVSRQLRQRDPERALTAASTAVPDFSGGTRLGETLRAFLDRWGQRGLARAAVVVLMSDGWERGGTSALAEQMWRLRRLVKAVVWANPHAGHAGYEAVQSGIVAALPYVDRFVAGHSLGALEQVWASVLSLSEGTPSGEAPRNTGSGPNAEVRDA